MKERVFFDDQGVKVTDTHFVVEGKYIELADITNIDSEISYKAPNKFWPKALIIAGLVLVVIGIFLALILVIIGAVWLWLKNGSPNWILCRLNNGESYQISNKDPDFISRLSDALEKALDNV